VSLAQEVLAEPSQPVAGCEDEDQESVEPYRPAQAKEYEENEQREELIVERRLVDDRVGGAGQRSRGGAWGAGFDSDRGTSETQDKGSHLTQVIADDQVSCAANGNPQRHGRRRRVHDLPERQLPGTNPG
jgi:hypothetical protein